MRDAHALGNARAAAREEEIRDGFRCDRRQLGERLASSQRIATNHRQRRGRLVGLVLRCDDRRHHVETIDHRAELLEGAAIDNDRIEPGPLDHRARARRRERRVERHEGRAAQKRSEHTGVRHFAARRKDAHARGRPAGDVDDGAGVDSRALFEIAIGQRRVAHDERLGVGRFRGPAEKTGAQTSRAVSRPRVFGLAHDADGVWRSRAN